MKERRTARRYDLALPVATRVPIEIEGVALTGKTRDISTRGVYFTINNDLRAGAKVDLTITLPAEVTGGIKVLIRATGQIVRVDQRPGIARQTVGVAAVFGSREIVRKEAAIS
jgi:hypothetical protein